MRFFRLCPLICALAASVVFTIGDPALARDTYVIDGAHLFTAQTTSSLDERISDFHQKTGKEIVIVTVPSLNGASLESSVEQTFAQQRVDGVLFFLASAEHKDAVVSDRASRTFFPAGSLTDVHNAMRSFFRSANFDEGITTGVNLVLDEYRSHMRSAPVSMHSQAFPAQNTAAISSQSSSIGGATLFWLIIILVVGFFIIRSIFRAIAGGQQRYMPPGYGPPGGGPGYGPPGYGGGMGGGMGGGGFFSGLLGGLGGAWLGNELFGHQNTFGQGQSAGFGPDPNAADQSGWQQDPGQVDMGNMGGGDYGGSDGGGGGGDWGGGGGGFDGGGGGFDGGGGGGW
ncbi:MAG TPA: TPM domain-containing protein [Candidatus Baltobacteraceae bacterium]|nr:TPM domain-containing protein [Candidatus Baltobacteraceae bacterium]